MLREGRAFRPWSIGQWLDGHHPDPLSGVSDGWGLAEPFRFYAHGLQSHPSRSLRVDRLDCQGISGTLHKISNLSVSEQPERTTEPDAIVSRTCTDKLEGSRLFSDIRTLTQKRLIRYFPLQLMPVLRLQKRALWAVPNKEEGKSHGAEL